MAPVVVSTAGGRVFINDAALAKEFLESLMPSLFSRSAKPSPTGTSTTCTRAIGSRSDFESACSRSRLSSGADLCPEGHCNITQECPETTPPNDVKDHENYRAQEYENSQSQVLSACPETACQGPACFDISTPKHTADRGQPSSLTPKHAADRGQPISLVSAGLVEVSDPQSLVSKTVQHKLNFPDTHDLPGSFASVGQKIKQSQYCSICDIELGPDDPMPSCPEYDNSRECIRCMMEYEQEMLEEHAQASSDG